MEIYLDSAKIEDIKIANSTGLLDGITTNPSLASKEQRPYAEVAKEIATMVTGSVSVEVLSTEYEAMLTESRQLAGIANNIVIKLPATDAGFKACKTLSAENIKVNLTLVFSAVQALLAAKAGAYICSVFVGRLDDAGSDGEEVVAEIRDIYDWYNFDTKILFASVRSVEHVKNAALLGSDIVTVPFDVFTKLAHHDLTVAGLEKFLADYGLSQIQS